MVMDNRCWLPGVGMGGGGMNQRGSRGAFLCSDETILYPNYGGGFKNLYMY